MFEIEFKPFHYFSYLIKSAEGTLQVDKDMQTI